MNVGHQSGARTKSSSEVPLMHPNRILGNACDRVFIWPSGHSPELRRRHAHVFLEEVNRPGNRGGWLV